VHHQNPSSPLSIRSLEARTISREAMEVTQTDHYQIWHESRSSITHIAGSDTDPPSIAACGLTSALYIVQMQRSDGAQPGCSRTSLVSSESRFIALKSLGQDHFVALDASSKVRAPPRCLCAEFRQRPQGSTGANTSLTPICGVAWTPLPGAIYCHTTPHSTAATAQKTRA
jgi:hypothetical protein